MSERYDVVIRGGTVVDGTGSPGRVADVGVRGDRIAAVGASLEGTDVVDAAGLVVAPGFIDIHSHADFTLAQTPAAPSALAQGVTTLVGGNCGHSRFPVTDLNRLSPGLAGVGEVPPPTWTDLAGFAAAVAASRPAVNLALQVGHNTVRAAVLGDDDREPTADELAGMCAFVAEAAAQGAYGFSTGLIYPPGVFSRTPEVVALVTAAARSGLFYSTHVRNETLAVVEAVDEAIDAARRAGARLEVSHLKSMGPAAVGLSGVALDHIHAARAEGVDVTCDVYPYTASSTSLASRLPAWALDGGAAAVVRRLADPETRERILADLEARFGRDIDPAGIVLSELGPGPFVDRVGRSVVQLGAELGVSPAEAVLAVLAGHGDVAIVNHAIDESDMRRVLADPLTAIGSDGWIMGLDGAGSPHPRNFGTFARVLGRYVREEHVLTLEDAVRKMTSLPAARVGIIDRGMVRPGLAADLTVFDPAEIADTSTYLHPWRAAVGTRYVLVNGRVAFDGGLTDERSGRVLRRSGSVGAAV